MGIDIYAKWRGQTKEEKEAQYTGSSIVAGGVGYLREAYHGDPYVTKFLVQEAFESGTAQIPASTLKERLPKAVILAMIREKKIYGKNDPSKLVFEEGGLEKLQENLKHIFSNETKKDAQDAYALDAETLATGKRLIEMKALPDYAQTFVDFVELCEKKEKETGEPCTIIAS